MMAAKPATSRDKSTPTVANVYTLPLSCQICFGKVKQPVLCSNFHVFCGTCIDTWLERSHRCPSCRVLIDHTNPVKHIRGGLNQAEEEDREKSTPELRKTRFDLMYREYEDIVEELEHEVKRLRGENARLKCQLTPEQGGGSGGNSNAAANEQQLYLLTGKLQDAQKLYDRVKQDISSLKKENHSLKETNANISHENRKLREEISNRSPHRFGRLTVATLEAQLESQRKEVQRLTRALERSDEYVENLEQQLQKTAVSNTNAARNSNYRAPSPHTHSVVTESSDSGKSARGSYSVSDSRLPVKRRLFASESESAPGQSFADSTRQLRSGDGESRLTNLLSSTNPGKTVGSRPEDTLESIMRRNDYSKNDSSKKEKSSPKKVHFNLTEKKSNDSSSFNLEVPSPIVPSAYNDSNNKVTAKLEDSELLSKQVHRKNHTLTSSEWEEPQRDWDLKTNLHKENNLSSVRVEPSLSGLGQPSSSSISTQNWKSEVSRKEQSREPNSSINLSGPEYNTPPSLSEFDSKRGKSAALQKHSVGRRDNRGNSQGTNASFDLEGPSLDDTQTIQTELKDLDISMTPELSDCLKLLNRAEKKCNHTELPDSTGQAGTGTTGNFGRVYASLGNHGTTAGYRTLGQSAQSGGMIMGKGSVHSGFHGMSGYPNTSGYPGTYIPGTTGVISGWEHGFFSNLRVNPYKHVAPHMNMAAANPKQDFVIDISSQPASSNHDAQSLKSGSDKLLFASDEEFRRSVPAQLPKTGLSSWPDSSDSKGSALGNTGRTELSQTSAVPSSSRTSLPSTYKYSRPLSPLSTFPPSGVSSSTARSQSSLSSAIPSSTAGLRSAGSLSNLTSLEYPLPSSSTDYSSSGFRSSSSDLTSAYSSNIPSSSGFSLQGSRAHDSGRHSAPSYTSSEHRLSGVTTSGSGQGDFLTVGRRSSNNYSYVSNASSQGGDNVDSTHYDSFLPEPKKRLFESEEDSDFEMPSKTTKIV